MVINDKVNAKTMVVKSNLPASDYVVNPYIGCPHKCIYCYASFMKRFTKHREEWGDFLDVKNFQIMGRNSLKGKVVLLSSVTDAYNPYEKRYCVVPEILQNLDSRGAQIEILTKSSLILRDIDILKKLKNVKVGISLNTLDDSFRKLIEPRASSVKERLRVLEVLNKNDIRTYLFVSPIFPEITNISQLLDATENFVDEYYFENLNLTGNSKKNVLTVIEKKYPDLLPIYNQIYNKGNMRYWEMKKIEIQSLFATYPKEMKLFFYHKNLK